MNHLTHFFPTALDGDPDKNQTPKSKSLRVVQTSTVTSKGQTTIPKAVREALSLQAGSAVSFEIGPNGVSMYNAQHNEDPIITAFLDFLERDMAKNPKGISPLSEALLTRSLELVGDGPVNLDEEIIGAVAI